MNRRDWLLSIIGWDGCLPVVVAIAPVILPIVAPKRDIAELTAAIMVPIIAAVARAQHGYRRLEARWGHATLGRPFLLGCAVGMLLLFEGFSGALLCARGVPPSAWLTAGTFYLVYLGLIVLALRPRHLVDA